jgi:hypothetical protein
MGNKVYRQCPHCGNIYTLGYNGVVGGCDNCLGVERDNHGYAWMPGESSMELIPAGAPLDTDQLETVTREEAMKGKRK